MSAGVIIIISMVIILTLIFMNVYVAIALGITGLLLLQFMVGGKMLVAGSSVWTSLDAFDFVPLPLFIFMGNIILHSGLGDRLYKGLTPWVSRLPGGLIHSNIASCTLFAAISGSSVATAGTIGAFAVPEMTKRNYDKKLILGSLAGAGALGLLIPPSGAMILYAGLTGVSLGHLFMGGIFPGIMISIFFMTFTAIRATLNPGLVPKEPKASWRERILGLYEIWPTVFLMLSILGGIYAGIVTPTEAAALGTVLAIILSLAHKKLNWQTFREATIGAIITIGGIIFIMAGAFVLHVAWGSLHVPREIVTLIISLNLSDWQVILTLMVMYILLGCIFEGNAMTLLTIPIVYPLILSLGYDPIWFGIALTMTIEIAQITPPVGLNLFVLSSISKSSIGDVIRGSIPFFFLHTLALALVCVFPQIALWLPEHSYAK